MIADAIAKIVQLATDAHDLKIKRVEGVPNRVWMLGRDGTATEIPITIPDWLVLDTCESFIDAIKEVLDLQVEGVRVFHNDDKLLADVIDGIPRSTYEMHLSRTDQFSLLDKLSSCEVRWYDHRGFLRLLRHDLAECGTEGTASIMQRVTFKQHSGGQSDISHGKESMGRSVNSAVDAIEELPQTLLLTVPVYCEFPMIYQQIMCSLEIDANAARFALTPRPGQMDQAVIDAQEEIGKHLSDALPPDVIVLSGECRRCD